MANPTAVPVTRANGEAQMSEFSRYLQDLARGLERWSHYVSSRDTQSIRGDIERRVRDYPIGALAVGFGIGYLLGKIVR